MTKQQTNYKLNLSRVHNNDKISWLLMLLYWSCGLVIGIRNGYIFEVFSNIMTYSSRSWFQRRHGYALAMTILLQSHMSRTRFCSRGRRRNTSAMIVFAVANGVAETMIFLAVYDFGKQQQQSNRSTLQLQRMGGFASFFIYSWLVHALFWMPLVFPSHIRQDAPSFLKTGLPVLVVISAIWLYLYEVYHEIAFVCALHCTVDFMAAYSIAFPEELPILHRKRKYLRE